MSRSCKLILKQIAAWKEMLTWVNPTLKLAFILLRSCTTVVPRLSRNKLFSGFYCVCKMMLLGLRTIQNGAHSLLICIIIWCWSCPTFQSRSLSLRTPFHISPEFMRKESGSHSKASPVLLLSVEDASSNSDTARSSHALLAGCGMEFKPNQVACTSQELLLMLVLTCQLPFVFSLRNCFLGNSSLKSKRTLLELARRQEPLET